MSHTPRWVWGLILALALQPVLVGLLCAYAAPPGTVSTGLQIPDSAIFLWSMRAPELDWYSPYAFAPNMHDWRNFAMPHLWLYIVLGSIGDATGLPDYGLYTVANALGVFAYLLAAWWFLRNVSPGVAPRAFLLFALGGGVGGIAYLVCLATGLHTHPAFEDTFLRWGLYEIMEGAHLLPVTIFPRAYYTLSLAALLAGFTAFLVRPAPGAGARMLWPPLMLAGAFLNARYAAFFLALGVLWLLAQPHRPTRRDVPRLLAYVLPLLFGAAASLYLMRQNPMLIGIHREFGNMAIWFSPLVLAAGLVALPAAVPVWRACRRGQRLPHALLVAGLCFLACYAAGYVLYAVYWGTLLRGNDGAVAKSISDWCLLLAAPVFVARLWRWPRAGTGPTAKATAPTALAGGARSPAAVPTFLALWLVGFTCLGLGGFFSGAYLELGPQRLLVLLWLPLCALAALGLQHWAPRWRTTHLRTAVACGATSVLVATLLFQSPVGRTNAEGPYAAQHAAIIHEDDAAAIAALPEERITTYGLAGDAVVFLRGLPVTHGVGSFNLRQRDWSPADGEYDPVREPGRAPQSPDPVFDPRTWTSQRAP